MFTEEMQTSRSAVIYLGPQLETAGEPRDEQATIGRPERDYETISFPEPGGNLPSDLTDKTPDMHERAMMRECLLQDESTRSTNQNSMERR